MADDRCSSAQGATSLLKTNTIRRAPPCRGCRRVAAQRTGLASAANFNRGGPDNTQGGASGPALLRNTPAKRPL